MSDARRPVEKALDLSGRVALVTGAGQGIGAGIALRFAEAGAAIGVHYLTSTDGAHGVVDAIEKDGGEAIPLQADVTKGEVVERLVADVVSRFGHLDILVNNAGIYPVDPMLDVREEAWDEVVDANLKSVFLCTQAAARRMIDAGKGGAIVNISSIEGVLPAPAHSHYASAKAGVLMHTKSAALELGPHNVRVNAVLPGLIDREGLADAWPDGVRRWLDSVPLGGMGTPLDVADAALFLASRAARWITGATLAVDGGMLSRPVF